MREGLGEQISMNFLEVEGMKEEGEQEIVSRHAVLHFLFFLLKFCPRFNPTKVVSLGISFSYIGFSIFSFSIGVVVQSYLMWQLNGDQA